MLKKIFVLSASVIAVLGATAASAASNSSATAPCAPVVWMGDEPSKKVATECGKQAPKPATPTFYGDRIYGPQLTSGCPNIPKSFDKVYKVGTASQFWSAVRKLGPGQAIIVSNGAKGGGWAGKIPASASGSVNKRSYILSESVHGAKFSGFSRWDVQASNITIAGFERSNSADITVAGDNIRWACNKNNGVKNAYAVYVPDDNPNFHNNFEMDHNTFLNGDWELYFNTQCQSFKSGCKGSNKRHHLHHNYLHSNRGALGHNMMYFGLAWSPENLRAPGSDPKNRQEVLFENNSVQWKQADSATLINIKSSGNTLRNNCFNNSRPLGVRMGNDNLITGNWYRGNVPFAATRPIGWRNVVAFNYFGNGGNAWPALELSQGFDDKRSGSKYQNSRYIWSYYSSSDGVYSNNVFNNFNGMIKVVDLQASSSLSRLPFGHSPDYKPLPKNNRIQNNVVRTSKYYGDYVNRDNSVTLSTFKANNPRWDSSNVVSSQLISGNAACGTAGIVKGVGGLSTTVPSGLRDNQTRITAPSWWSVK